MSQVSDQESAALVSKAVNGDKQALNDLIRLHEPFIYNVAWKFVGNPEDAKDLTQEVRIEAQPNGNCCSGK